MSSTKTITIGTAVFTAIAIVIFWPRDKTSGNHAPVADASKTVKTTKPGSTRSGHGTKQESAESKPNPRPVRQWDGPRASAVNFLLDRWDEISTEKGAASAKARQDLAQQALDSLGGGAALGAFIEGLYERRATDMVDWLIANGSKMMFAGKEGEKGRAWLLGVVDEKLRNRLAYEAGYHFAGPGIKDYMITLSPNMAQDRFLTGFTCGIAETDGFQAMKEFSELKTPGVSNYGMKEIMMRLPETTDFSKMGTLYPGDDKSLAREIRAEMIKRWVQFKPEDAAQYVVKNPTIVCPEQMGVVVTAWAEKSPDSASNWLDKAPVGKPRDEGMAALAKLWSPNDPAKGWSYAAQVTDFDKRVASATGVFRAWEKTDRAAAVKAWTALFPSEQSH